MKSRKRLQVDGSYPRVNLITMILVVAGLCLFSALAFYYRATTTTSKTTSGDTGMSHTIASNEEYHHLVKRAHRLLRKYQALRGGNTTLPAHLASFELPDLPPPPPPPPPPHQQGSSDSHQVAGEEEHEEDDQQHVVQTYPMQSTARDAVLGMAYDIDPKNLVIPLSSPLVSSLSQDSLADPTGWVVLSRLVSTCAIIIFVNNPVPAKSLEIMLAHNVKVMKFSVEDLPASMQTYHPSTLRWILFQNYFESNEKILMLYNRLWFVDVRDTYFQSDPFLFVNPNQPSFHVFQGVESFPIRECGWNSGWIKDCFSQSMVNTVGDNPIICSGVSVGTTREALSYTKKMATIVKGEQSDVPHQFPRCERNGVDQGVHNVLVHTKRIGHMQKWDQRSGPVANMQAKVARVNADHEVVNSKGEKYAVVHQYDRFPDLQRFLFRKGKCDLTGRGGATSAASCCKICNGNPGCQSFTFLAGTCFLKTCAVHNTRGGMKMTSAISGWKIQ
eukprot:scaffold760_cov178-Ochromonas_danica.AAC.12